MNVGCRWLDKLMVPYRLTDGTILGIYREGEFIKHDNDIDVDVFDIDNQIIESIIKYFLKGGFKIGRKAYYKGAMQQVVFYNDREVIFDILFWYRNDKEYVNNSERGYIREQESRYFESLGEITFKGEVYKCPPDIERWLEMRYGEGWNVPKTYKGDWKDDCFDIKSI
jgi:phosphorylcholine metabolism protein LicD